MENFIVNLVSMVRSPKKREPPLKPAPYKRKPKTPHQKDGPATSTKRSDPSGRKNLTLNDWLMVSAYIDEHPCCVKSSCMIARAGADSSLDLIHKLRAFRATLRREELQNAKQATLDQLWNTK
ncbi:hypothetical protein F4604DRAFT_1805511 [Suillus subluteus]|nr:hypothetical protein F4604DRAFT_1805511 [Suillus subluteus]